MAHIVIVGASTGGMPAAPSGSASSSIFGGSGSQRICLTDSICCQSPYEPSEPAGIISAATTCANWSSGDCALVGTHAAAPQPGERYKPI